MSVERAPALERELHAKRFLALMDGVTSYIQLPIHDTLYNRVLGDDGRPYVRESHIRTHYRLAVMAPDDLPRIGEAKHNNDYMGRFSANYFFNKADRSFMRNGPVLEADKLRFHEIDRLEDIVPYMLNLIEAQVESNLRTFAKLDSAGRESFRREVMDPSAIDSFVDSSIQAMRNSLVLYAAAHDPVRLVQRCELPFYVLGRSAQGGMSLLVSDDRSLPPETMTWTGLADRFEFWEREFLAAQMSSEPMARTFLFDTKIKIEGEHCADAASVLRSQGTCLPMMFMQRVAADILRSVRFGNDVEHLAQGLRYSKGDGGVLTGCASGLQRIYKSKQGDKLREFVSEQGWDLEISPFEMMVERMKSYPQPVAKAQLSVENARAPAL
jgi:hypothetical protein